MTSIDDIMKFYKSDGMIIDDSMKDVKMQPRVGLANIGNTCFLNVILQGLRMSPPILKTLLEDPKHTPAIRKASKKGRLLAAFQSLVTTMMLAKPTGGAGLGDSTPTVIPRMFFDTFRQTLKECDDDWYMGGEQADASECCRYFLDMIHDALYRTVSMSIVPGKGGETDIEKSQTKALETWVRFFSKEYSPIVSNFYGQTRSITKCTGCNNEAEIFEPWMNIECSIPGSDKAGTPVPNMDMCLAHNFATENIDEYNCEKCNSKQKAIRTHAISKTPNVMIITLKRFTNFGAKVRGRVDWDLNNVDLSPLMAFSSPFGDGAPQYETYAVVEHHGSMIGGHYIMYGRGVDDMWFEYDDSRVKRVSTDYVISADSYVIFMTRKGTYNEFVKTELQTIVENVNSIFGQTEMKKVEPEKFTIPSVLESALIKPDDSTDKSTVETVKEKVEEKADEKVEEADISVKVIKTE